MSLSSLGMDMDVGLSSGPLQSMFKPGDTEDLMKAVGLRNDELQKRSAAVQDIFAEQKAAEADLLKQQGTVGENSQIVLQAKELSALDVQDKTLAQANKLHINPGGSSELLDQISNEWVASKQDGIAKRAKLKADMEVSFLEHPIDYVVAQIGMEKTVHQAEVANARTGAAMKDMADIQNLTQQLPGQMAALAKTRTSATVQATLEGAAAQIATNLDKIKIDNAGTNINRITALNNMNKEQLGNLTTAITVKFQQHSQDNQDAHLKLAQSSAVLAEKQFNLNYEARQEALEMKKLDRLDMADMTTLIRKGASGMGIDISKLPDQRILQMVNSKNADVSDYYKAGLASESAGTPIVSLDSGRAARMIVQHNAPLRLEQKPIATMMRSSWEEAQNNTFASQNGGYDTKNIEGVTVGARTSVNRKALAMQADINPADGSNIYSAPPLPSVLAVKGVQDTKWYQSVMAPQMQAGGLKEFNPEQLLAITAQAVKSGKISYNEGAEGLKNTFGAAVALNNATKNYEGFGITPQGSFNTKIPNSIGVPTKYNLLTPQDLTRALNSKMKEGGIEGGMGNGGFGLYN